MPENQAVWAIYQMENQGKETEMYQTQDRHVLDVFSMTPKDT